MKTLYYKGYTGSIEFSVEDNILFGQLLGIRSLIMYEGETLKELVEDFHIAVDDYLESCKIDGMEPEVPFKGSFNVRINNKLHENAVRLAHKENISLNSLVEKALEAYVSKNIKDL